MVSVNDHLQKFAPIIDKWLVIGPKMVSVCVSAIKIFVIGQSSVSK